MLEVYKYLHCLYDTDRPNFEIATDSHTRGSTLKLKKTRSYLDVRKGFFSMRVMNTWNTLSDNVVQALTVNAFKTRLDAFWRNLEMK